MDDASDWRRGAVFRAGPLKERDEHMTQIDVHGPVDYLVMEFSGDRLTGRAAEAMLDLVERGIVRVYDVVVVGKDKAGDVYAVNLADEESEVLGSFTGLSWARTGLLADEVMREAASAMEPGTLAVLLVYENTWAIPFVAAARESGGELIAGGRIPAQDVMDALAALDESDHLQPTT
jgi:hypothetical protein